MSRLLGTLVLVTLAGCTDPIADEGTVGGDGKADGISGFKLAINRTQAGLLRAKESPKLPGAPSGSNKFTCPTDDRTAGGRRMLCERNDERLAVTFGPDEMEGAAIYLASASAPDRRSFFHCSTTTVASDEWPAALDCVAKRPSSIVGGQLVSPFASTIDGVGISNAHLVSVDATTGAKLVRGMKPFRDADFEDLEGLGVEAVLIFKKPTKTTEVADEIAALAPIGVPDSQVVNEQFLFKDFPDFTEPCRMTVRSLAQLRDWTASGKTTFFHCTVGEDRTGYLAGLYRLLTERAPVETIFEDEMCERGYSAGNPQKPFARVVDQIDQDMTPLFLKMAFKIAKGELTPTSLDEGVCATDPETDPEFAVPQWDAEGFRCVASTRYRL